VAPAGARRLTVGHERCVHAPVALWWRAIGTAYAPHEARRRRGTGAQGCSPASRQRVAVSDGAVVPGARLGAWLGEAAAAAVVTTRGVSAHRGRSWWADGLHPPLPRLRPRGGALPWPWRQGRPQLWRPRWPAGAPSCSASCFWRVPCPAASPPPPPPPAPLQPDSRRARRTPRAARSGRPSAGAVSRRAPSRPCPPRAPPLGPPPVCRFGAGTAALHPSAAWLRQGPGTTGALASTGVSGLPLSARREHDGFPGLRGAPRPGPRAPQRPKPAVHACQGRQRLHRLGLLPAAGRPAAPIE
jgi:hypothetical protein